MTISQSPDEIARPGMTESATKRFWSKVEKPSEDYCWEWKGYLTAQGYGSFSVNAKGVKRTYRAHRLAYELLVGIPKLQLDHLCRNRWCVNPAHLEDVESRVNNLRGFSPPANNARKTHCSNGHELFGSNLVTVRTVGRPDHRGCRKCRIIAKAKWRKKTGLLVRTHLLEQETGR